MSRTPCIRVGDVSQSATYLSRRRRNHEAGIDAPKTAERRGYGSSVCINITSYADHSDRLK
jgi:hypothetical protein